MIIAVTADRFELPMAVFESAHEAARQLRTSPGTISHAVHRKSISELLGGGQKVIFMRIEEDPDDADEA